MKPDNQERRRLPHPVTPGIWLLLGLSVIPELVLTGSDMGVWGGTYWRPAAYQYGGFWAGLLDDWQPNYPLQPALMFVTYGFLHAGLWHLALNMLALVSLAPQLAAQLGERHVLGLYALAQLCGALGFALLGPVDAPMIGASGALFGLAGAYLADRHARHVRMGRSPWPVYRVLLWLVVLNVVFWWALEGQLAWETHLGGFIAGWLYARLVGKR